MFGGKPARQPSASSMVRPSQPEWTSSRSAKTAVIGMPHSASPCSTRRAHSTAVKVLVQDPMCHRSDIRTGSSEPRRRVPAACIATEPSARTNAAATAGTRHRRTKLSSSSPLIGPGAERPDEAPAEFAPGLADGSSLIGLGTGRREGGRLGANTQPSANSPALSSDRSCLRTSPTLTSPCQINLSLYLLSTRPESTDTTRNREPGCAPKGSSNTSDTPKDTTVKTVRLTQEARTSSIRNTRWAGSSGSNDSRFARMAAPPWSAGYGDVYELGGVGPQVAPAVAGVGGVHHGVARRQPVGDETAVVGLDLHDQPAGGDVDHLPPGR